MAMQSAKVTITGTTPLLQNNPQTVDPFNRFAKLKKSITDKRKKTDDDLIELRDIETESKVFFDSEIGVYVPATWLTESICATAFSVAKIGRQKMRGGLFSTENKIKLIYENMDKVKDITDIVKNPVFRHSMILPQGKVRVHKDMPIFHKWSFSTQLEFDDTVIDFGSLTKIVKHAAKYGGFGDFRPTFGRASAEINNG